MKDEKNKKMSEECVLQCVWKSYHSQKRWNDEQIIFIWEMKIMSRRISFHLHDLFWFVIVGCAKIKKMLIKSVFEFWYRPLKKNKIKNKKSDLPLILTNIIEWPFILSQFVFILLTLTLNQVGCPGSFGWVEPDDKWQNILSLSHSGWLSQLSWRKKAELLLFHTWMMHLVS